MNFEAWVAFAVACSVLSLIPGPAVLLVVGQALSFGKTNAFFCIIGNMFGGLFLIALSLAGVGTILAASFTLFLIVKWAGVFYMAYLGYCQIMAARRDVENPTYADNSNNYYGSMKAGFLSAVLNPKTVIFYMAFLVQFMDPNVNQVLQTFILIVTSVAIAGLVLVGYGLIANRARTVFQSRKARKNINYAGGGCLISGSVVMAVTR